MREGTMVGTSRPTQRRSDERPAAETQRRRALVLCSLALPLLIALYVLVIAFWARPATYGDQLRLDQFLERLDRGAVHSATILAVDDRLIGTVDGGHRYWVDFSGDHESLFARLTGALEQAKVPTTVRAQPLKAMVGPVSVLLPALVLFDGILLMVLLSRGGGSLAGFGRAGARRVGDGEPTVTFADLAGVDEAVEELAEVRDYLVDPARFSAMGASVPKGILLTGPPGCGKTRLAQALAGECAVPFFTISGSDFVEMYVGVGAARIRDLFAQAESQAPAIVFIDEIDAVGRARGVSGAGGSDEREATLNQLLVEMDGFAAESGIVVLAATNRPDVLDAALLRPGRFDRRVTVDPPDRDGRRAILAVHARGKPLAPDVDLDGVASQTVGFSGADLASVVNEAALLAIRESSAAIDVDHLSEAVERVVAGPQRRSRVLSPGDRRRVACHEAGHAIVGAALAGTDPVAKVSLVARGRGAGFTVSVPAGDRLLFTGSELHDRIAALLGGRAAEQVVFGEPSTGANDDLAQAAALARRMVWECGMSARLGPVSFVPEAGPAGGISGWSDRMAAEVDTEVVAILRRAEQRASEILRANSGVLADLGAELCARETLEGDALARFLDRVDADGEPVASVSRIHA